MLKPDEEITRAIMNLNGNASWERIIKWIEDSLTDQSKKNLWLDGENTHKGQGMGLELDSLLKYITNAYTYAKNFKKR